MNRVAILNPCTVRSTGKIAVGLHKYLVSKGYDSEFCYGRPDIERDDSYHLIDTKYEVYLHALFSKITGYQGGGSFLATKRLIRHLKNRKVDTVFIISLHTYYINEFLLYKYLIAENIKVVYVMIDEYAYLGRCPYNQNCGRLEKGCGNCPHRKEFGLFDSTHRIFQNKWDAYSELTEKGNIIFVGPEFVTIEASKSPLMKGAKMHIVDEAIDTTFYTPRDCKKLREELGIAEDQIVLTHIAPMNQPAKGSKYFIETARHFENNSKFKFVHVGYNIEDKSNLPSNYIPIGYVKDQNKLAEFYSLGDLFIFPSVSDTMSNACLEALSAGTPLLCFNISGMPFLGDSSVLTLVEPYSTKELIDVVARSKKKTDETVATCRNYALSRYDNQKYFEKLVAVTNEFKY